MYEDIPLLPLKTPLFERLIPSFLFVDDSHEPDPPFLSFSFRFSLARIVSQLSL